MLKNASVRKQGPTGDCGCQWAVSARRVGRDEKMAGQDRASRRLPSPRKQPRTSRTRKGPFAEVWQPVEVLLQNEPGLQAKTVFDWLEQPPPAKFEASQGPTLERRVPDGRVTSGPTWKVILSHVHHAGDLAASDFTDMSSLGLTIAGQRGDHLVYHSLLTYPHIIDQRLCKPDALENDRDREELLPLSRFLQAYDRLSTEHTLAVGSRAYQRILQHAARDSEPAVEDAVRWPLPQDQPLCAETVIAAVPQRVALPASKVVTVQPPDRREFDDLLQHQQVYHAKEAHRSQFAAVGHPLAPLQAPNRNDSLFAAEPVPESDTATERPPEGAVASDVLRALPVAGEPDRAGVTEPQPILGATGEPRVPDVEPQPDSVADAQRAVTAGQDLGAVPVVGGPPASCAAVEEPDGRELPGPARKRIGLREPRCGENGPPVSSGGSAGPARPHGAVHQVQLLRAGTARGQTRTEAHLCDQKTGWLRGIDCRRLGLYPAEPPRDESLVRAAGGTLPTWQCATNRRPPVLPTGTALLGSNDHRCRHRPFGAPTSDHREHSQRPFTDSPEHPEADSRSHRFRRQFLIHFTAMKITGNLMVAKPER